MTASRLLSLRSKWPSDYKLGAGCEALNMVFTLAAAAVARVIFLWIISCVEAGWAGGANVPE